MRDYEGPKSKFEWLLDLLKDSDNGFLTVRDLKKSHGFQEKDLDLMLEFHPDLICRDVIKPTKQGRPSPLIRLVAAAA
jgi:hypothetical protein